jgi:hypothetical protein
VKPLSERDLLLNQQAVAIASSVLNEPVEAATRCEQVTLDMANEAAGISKFTRRLSRMNKAMEYAMPSTSGHASKQMETAGLPPSFVLAVTRDGIHALEDNQQGDDLVPGKVLKSWNRAGFVARRSTSPVNVFKGVPDDRQVLILFLPIEAGWSRVSRAMADNSARAGAPGFPHKVMVAHDAASERVIEVLGANGAGPNISVGPNVRINERSLQDLVGQATPSPAPTAQRLQELETLRTTGVITGEEYGRKREQIINEL